MALKILWTKRANSSFSKMVNYLEKEFGEMVVKKFIKRVNHILYILSEFPEIGTIESFEKQIRGFNIIPQVNVFYRIKENQIILLHFFDNRQNPDKK